MDPVLAGLLGVIVGGSIAGIITVALNVANQSSLLGQLNALKAIEEANKGRAENEKFSTEKIENKIRFQLKKK